MHNRLLICLTLFFLIVVGSNGQERRKEIQILTDSVPDDVVFNVYDFEGVNKYARYYNKQKLEKIAKLDADQNWEELFEALKEYVGKFGIQNFYKDTKLIWRLAKMTELLGDPDEAKTLYRMVLRHHFEDISIKEIELYYDSLNKQAAEQYLVAPTLIRSGRWHSGLFHCPQFYASDSQCSGFAERSGPGRSAQGRS